jgi:hypothetical protein
MTGSHPAEFCFQSNIESYRESAGLRAKSPLIESADLNGSKVG